MADLPRDPRQLARDILAGKVSIEDLAREQARRRAGGQPPRAEPPRQVPLPRTGPVPPPVAGPSPLPPPVQRPAPARPPQRVPQRQAPPPVRRPAPRAPAPRATTRGPQIVVPRSTPATARPMVEQPPATEVTAKPPGTSDRPAAQSGSTPLATLLRQPGTLRQGIILAEILGPPVALRDGPARS